MNRKHFFFSMIFVSLVLVGVSCSCGDKPAPAPAPMVEEAPPAPTACDLSQETVRLGTEFPGVTVKQPAPDVLVTTGTQVGSDGQIQAKVEREFIFTWDNGNCVRRNTVARKIVGQDTHEDWFMKGETRFYRSGRLVFVKTALRDGYWHVQYTSPADIPQKVPSWAVESGHDMYLTWVFTGNNTTVRIPVWVQEGIWGVIDGYVTLMAGNVYFKNPQKGVVTEELYSVMRLSPSGSVDPRAVLYPVNKASIDAYHDYLGNKVASWERDRDSDMAYMEETFLPLAKSWNKPRRDLLKVLERRGAALEPGETVTPPFVPAFFLLKQL